MACNVQSLMDSAACFACLSEREKTSLELVLLAQWAGYTGTVQELMDSAACFACLSPEAKSAIETRLLCQIAVGEVTCFTLEMSSTYDDGTCSGTATATPSGGVGPYSYQWSNGQTTQTATGLCAGSYDCIVVDIGRGGVCSDAGTVAVQSISDLLQFSGEIDDDGTCSGGVTVTALFGTGPYTYIWQEDTGTQGAQFTDTLTSACGPSDWHIEVTDSLGEVITGTWHVYRAEHEETLVDISDNFNFRPLETEQTNEIEGVAKFDSSLGTLLGVTFGFSTLVAKTLFASDPDVRTNNTSASARSIKTDFSQVAEFMFESSIIKTINYSTSATNNIAGNFFALPAVASGYEFGVGEIPENTDQDTLDAVTGIGDVSGLELKSYVPVVTLTVLSGPATPDPTWSYVSTVSQPRPQIYGFVYVQYRYLVPRS